MRILGAALQRPQGGSWAPPPVPCGLSRVRLHSTIIDVTEKNPGQWLLKARNTLEIEGVDKPAFISEGLSLYFV